MEIVLALIYGAAVGALAHFTLPGRDTRGAALPPLVGAVVGGGIWTVLTWAGLTTSNAVLWLTALILPAAVVYIGVPILTRLRNAHDERERIRLNIV